MSDKYLKTPELDVFSLMLMNYPSKAKQSRRNKRIALQTVFKSFE
jgi:hypothetical protein